MEKLILQKLGWNISHKEELELTYFLKENENNIGTLHIINQHNQITIEFKPLKTNLCKYFIVYDKTDKNFDLTKSTFKLDNKHYLKFLDTLGKEISNQEKSYN